MGIEQGVAIVPCKICLSLLSPAQPSLLEACACRSNTHTHTERRSIYYRCDNVQCMDTLAMASALSGEDCTSSYEGIQGST